MHGIVRIFIAIVLTLATFGILTLASASSAKYETANYFVIRQIIWLLFAFGLAIFVTRVDYSIYKNKYVVSALSAFSLLLLVLVRIPGVGTIINGSYRWLRIGPVTIQPSEIAKVAVIILFSWWLARNQRRIKEVKRGIVYPTIFIAPFVALLIAEPDFGTTMLISSVVISMMFIAGVLVMPMLVASLLGLLGIVGLIFHNPERMSRIFAFLDPQKYEQSKAWQLTNSLRAFASGGFKGRGFGNSMQKYHYLPEAHTDFIYPIIGEEFGLIASLVVLLFYVILFVLGLKIAANARDDFGRFLAFGITLMITMQALINLAVVTGCVPTKGLALPFISYGGSSLVISGVMVGILVNIARNAVANGESPESPFKDKIRTT